jgi:serine/threonine protein kinase
MFCSRCGSEITGKSKFCPSCGLDLLATTPVHALATGSFQETDIVREALAAEYEIMEELGRGGMAMVYRARDRQLEREVAIKVLPFSLAFDSEFVERFQREARTAAQLEHPNIIAIYRVGRSGRVIYFVMKYLRGGSLATVVKERKKLNPPEIRRLLTEAGRALGYAAQRGIVHRDIKPDNIMFDEFGQSVLTDFGIAKAASGQKLTGTGMSIGTPHYMSPEQARAQAIDGRSDIYSLGVVAYQCLTGTVPYDGEDSFSIGYKHITEPIPTPTLVTADERRIYEVIKRMLMKDPADRFQSCEELVASIQGQPTAAPGAMRSSTARAAVSAGGLSATRPSPIGGVPPLIVSQPTTPLDSPIVDRRAVPRTPHDSSRRVADRSLAMRGGGSSWGWLWIVIAVGLLLLLVPRLCPEQGGQRFGRRDAGAGRQCGADRQRTSDRQPPDRDDAHCRGQHSSAGEQLRARHLRASHNRPAAPVRHAAGRPH